MQWFGGVWRSNVNHAVRARADRTLLHALRVQENLQGASLRAIALIELQTESPDLFRDADATDVRCIEEGRPGDTNPLSICPNAETAHLAARGPTVGAIVRTLARGIETRLADIDLVGPDGNSNCRAIDLGLKNGFTGRGYWEAFDLA